jgi:cytochrome b pre-mRNA-processing protein 3
MILPLFRRGARPDTISALYGTIVAQARLPCFYQDYSVPDTVNGRFDVIVLHLILVLERLAADAALRDFGQGLFDAFCADMDHNLREMGVGDLAVPKKMRAFGEAFYGRAAAYREALADANEETLVLALRRNVYGGGIDAGAAPARLAAYMRKAAGDLAEQDSAALGAGTLHFPDPAAVAAMQSLSET